MILPIDAREGPFKTKYLDEETPLLSRWMVFGYDPDDDTVCVSDAKGDDVIIGMDKGAAEALCQLRNEFIERVVNLVNASGKSLPESEPGL